MCSEDDEDGLFDFDDSFIFPLPDPVGVGLVGVALGESNCRPLWGCDKVTESVLKSLSVVQAPPHPSASIPGVSSNPPQPPSSESSSVSLPPSFASLERIEFTIGKNDLW